MASILTQLRRAAYRAGRLAGDVQAVQSGKPSKIATRGVNKVIGRKLISKLWRK